MNQTGLEVSQSIDAGQYSLVMEALLNTPALDVVGTTGRPWLYPLTRPADC